jgi:hypothetical protein
MVLGKFGWGSNIDNFIEAMNLKDINYGSGLHRKDFKTKNSLSHEQIWLKTK